MHTKCHVVHTDLKPDNIMMGLGEPKILKQGVQDEAHYPSAREIPNSIAESSTNLAANLAQNLQTP
jgi:serine/threonine protein kinase